MATYNLKRKTYSGQEYYEEEPQENLYSVLMSEDEIRLFSEFLEEREYSKAVSTNDWRKELIRRLGENYKDNPAYSTGHGKKNGN